MTPCEELDKVLMENGSYDDIQKLRVALESDNGKTEIMKNAFDKVLEPILGTIKNLIAKAQNRPVIDSKGDISKIKDIETTDKVVNLLLKSSNAKVKTAATDLKQLRDNIKNRKTSFQKAYNMRATASGSLAYSVYVTSVECYVRGVSMLVGYQTEQFKKDTFVLGQVKKYNEYYKRGMVDKFLNLALDKQKATVGEGGFMVDHGELKTVQEGPVSVAVGALAIGAVLTFAFFLRVLVFYFYWSRTEISEYFAEQANFLNIHEAEIKKNANLSKEEKDSIINAQRKWSQALMHASDFFAVEDIKAAQKAANSVKSANKEISPDSISVDNTGMDFF